VKEEVKRIHKNIAAISIPLLVFFTNKPPLYHFIPFFCELTHFPPSTPTREDNSNSDLSWTESLQVFSIGTSCLNSL